MRPEARKKFGALVFEPKQMYCIEGSTCDIVGIFRRPGHCPPRYAPEFTLAAFYAPCRNLQNFYVFEVGGGVCPVVPFGKHLAHEV